MCTSVLFSYVSVVFSFNISKVSDARNADCTVIEYPMMCPVESLNTGNCSSYKWTASVEVSSGTIRESKIKVSTDEVVIAHRNLTDANFSVEISIRYSH